MVRAVSDRLGAAEARNRAWAASLILIGARLCPQDQSQGLRRVNALRQVLRTQPRSIMRLLVPGRSRLTESVQ